MKFACDETRLVSAKSTSGRSVTDGAGRAGGTEAVSFLEFKLPRRC